MDGANRVRGLEGGKMRLRSRMRGKGEQKRDRRLVLRDKLSE